MLIYDIKLAVEKSSTSQNPVEEEYTYEVVGL